MTTYTLAGIPGNYQWGDPATWVGGVVPNAPDADVVFPTITMTSTGQTVSSDVTLSSGSYAIRSLAVNTNELQIGGPGALMISGALTSDGDLFIDTPLSVGSLTNQGLIGSAGSQIVSAGPIVNSGTIGEARSVFFYYPEFVATPITLTLDAPSIVDTGPMAGVLIETPAGGFANLQNGTLSGGSFVDPALNVGATIVTDATALSLYDDPAAAGYASGPSDEEYDPTTGTYIPIESTLRTVAASGSLTTGGSYTTSSLTIDGVLDATENGAFQAGQLTIDQGGIAILQGIVTAAIIDDGVIKTVGNYVGIGPAESIPDLVTAPLVIDGAISGSGTLEIEATIGGHVDSRTVLELNGPASVAVAFDDSRGTLILDQPTSFAGTIKPYKSGDIINLPGLSPGSIAGEVYTGNSSGGTLTLTETDGTTVALRFVGNYDQGNFVLSNGQTYSTSPPSLDITVGALFQTGNAFEVDGSQGVQTFRGTGYPNFIDTSGAAGTGAVAVDLVAGTAAKGGQLDATFTNIQGVQLGADTSAILGLTTGTDLFYGGSGTDTFNGNGATDYIQGCTGSNLVFGGTGNEIFYGNGGIDVMRGGSAANFMAGSPVASGSDVFYGTTGNDYVYGNGGAVYLVGGSGNEFLSGGSGGNELDDRQQQGQVGLSQLVGSNGTDLFYGGIGTNLMDEGSGTDTFVGSAGTDYIYGGSGRSFTYAGSGTDVVTTGSGNDYVQAGAGALYINDTAANLHAGSFDEIDGFLGSKSTDLYLPGTVQGATSFVSQNGVTAIVTTVNGGSAEMFVSGASVASVQAHTHFTL